MAGCASPLGKAAADGDVKEVRRLVDAGAPLDEPDADAETPLMRAARAGQAGTVKALLDAGANPNASSRAGTALEMAARYGRLEAGKALLDGGAAPTTRAYDLAKQGGHVALAEAIGAAVAPGPDRPSAADLTPGKTISHGNLDPDALKRMFDSSRQSKEKE